MNLQDLPRDIICEICKYLHDIDIRNGKINKSIYVLNMVNKQMSRKVTYYMANNLIYNCHDNNIFVDMMSYDPNKYKTTHIKYIKKIVVNDMKTLQFFGNNITELYICHGFNKFIGNLDLHNLKKISFGHIFDQPISESFDEVHWNLPNLEELSFGYAFNHSFYNLNLQNLRELSFGHHFDKNFSFNCPNLKILSFGSNFSRSIAHLKLLNLEKLSFGTDFNQSIECLELPNLRELLFGHSFDHPIENLKSPKLEILQLGINFTKPVSNFKFINIKKLIWETDNCNILDDFNCSNLNEICIRNTSQTYVYVRDRLAKKYSHCKITTYK